MTSLLFYYKQLTSSTYCLLQEWRGLSLHPWISLPVNICHFFYLQWHVSTHTPLRCHCTNSLDAESAVIKTELRSSSEWLKVQQTQQPVVLPSGGSLPTSERMALNPLMSKTSSVIIPTLAAYNHTMYFLFLLNSSPKSLQSGDKDNNRSDRHTAKTLPFS